MTRWHGLALAAAVLLPVGPAQGAASELPGFGLPVAGLVQMVLGLAVVLGMILGVAWLLRRYSPVPRGGTTLHLRGGVSVGTRERVVLVEVEGVRLVLGVAPGRVQTLYVLEGKDDGFARELAAAAAGERHDTE